jgi:F-type H+-transporting ATPase subunit b
MRFKRGVPVLLVLWALAAWSAAALPALAGQGKSAAGPASGEGGAGPEINPMAWNTDLAVWTAVVFLLVLAILWRFAWKPIASGLDKREQRIRDEIASAEKAHAEAQQLLADYQKRLAETGEEVRKMLEAARRESERQGQQIIAEARAAAEAEKQRGLNEIQRATAGALKELADRSAALAVELAGQIVGARLDQASHAQLIERAVADFVRTGPNGN